MEKPGKTGEWASGLSREVRVGMGGLSVGSWVCELRARLWSGGFGADVAGAWGKKEVCVGEDFGEVRDSRIASVSASGEIRPPDGRVPVARSAMRTISAGATAGATPSSSAGIQSPSRMPSAASSSDWILTAQTPKRRTTIPVITRPICKGESRLS